MFEVKTNHNYYYQCCETACHYNIKIPSVQTNHVLQNKPKHNNTGPSHYTYFLLGHWYNKPFGLHSCICIDLKELHSTEHPHKHLLIKSKRKEIFLYFPPPGDKVLLEHVGVEIKRNTNKQLSGLLGPQVTLYIPFWEGKTPLITTLKYWPSEAR